MDVKFQDPALSLKLHLPPQPFIGSPQSKIWLLQFNPGYSAYDEYDYCGNDTLGLKPDDCHIRRGRTDSLDSRIRSVCKQYNLRDSGQSFYALDDLFFNFTRGIRGKGRGTYLWYNSTLYPKNNPLLSFVGQDQRMRFASENIFVLECMPYHSQAFNHPFFCKLPSFVFCKKLLRYAFAHQKIVLCKAALCAKIKSIFKDEGGDWYDAYQTALDGGFLYRICGVGKGRSFLSLTKSGVVPVTQGATTLQDFLQEVRCRYV
jgi:hypothetical protein